MSIARHHAEWLSLIETPVGWVSPQGVTRQTPIAAAVGLRCANPTYATEKGP